MTAGALNSDTDSAGSRAHFLDLQHGLEQVEQVNGSVSGGIKLQQVAQKEP